ncbi:MAG: tetratricopeptide repeat protein [Limisphaerales bacterium]
MAKTDCHQLALALLLLCVFALIPCASHAATNDLTALLQKGLFEEQANQNLDAAIANYQTLARQFDKDRQLAATAVFRIGECYRMQGRTNEAAGQYQRILKDFSDQGTLATLSRQNLAGTGNECRKSDHFICSISGGHWCHLGTGKGVRITKSTNGAGAK